MKTMTCRQLGGPCDFPHHANTADEVIKAQDKHLKDVVAQGDATHESALEEMEGPLEASHFRNGLVQEGQA
jgi:predicted small metal-binding protein